MPTLISTAAVFFVLLAGPAAAQVPAFTFEAATIRIVDDPHPQNVGRRVSPSHLRLFALPLREIIASAYGVEAGQVIAPDWTATTRVEIDAVLPPNSGPEVLMQMLRALLVERSGM